MLSAATPRAVAVGSGVAVVATILGYLAVISGLRMSQGVPPGAPVLITAGSFVLLFLAGALAFALGGYAAGRVAGHEPTPHGLAVATFGLLTLVVIGLFTFFFVGGMMIILPLLELVVILAIAGAIGFGLASGAGILGARVALAGTVRLGGRRPARA